MNKLSDNASRKKLCLRSRCRYRLKTLYHWQDLVMDLSCINKDSLSVAAIEDYNDPIYLSHMAQHCATRTCEVVFSRTIYIAFRCLSSFGDTLIKYNYKTTISKVAKNKGES